MKGPSKAVRDWLIVFVAGLIGVICLMHIWEHLTGHEHEAEAATFSRSAGFGMHCTDVKSGEFDPIVYPGKKPAGHRHVFWGAKNVGYDSTSETLSNGGTSCFFTDGSNGSNKSSYWAPDLKTRFGDYAGIRGVNIYYHNGTLDAQEIQEMRPFPAGFKLVAENVPRAKAGWSCTTSSGFLAPLSNYPRDCPVGSVVAFRMNYPNCGNGQVDSADHNSHVVYPVNGHCPADHPEVYPELIPIVHYGTRFGEGAKLSSGDPWMMLHSDYMEGWDPSRLQAFINRCNKAGINCKHQP